MPLRILKEDDVPGNLFVFGTAFPVKYFYTMVQTIVYINYLRVLLP